MRGLGTGSFLKKKTEGRRAMKETCHVDCVETKLTVTHVGGGLETSQQLSASMCYTNYVVIIFPYFSRLFSV